MANALKDGVIKRGGTWSYVLRVPDPTTGKTKAKWFGGFAPHATPATPATERGSA